MEETKMEEKKEVAVEPVKKVSYEQLEQIAVQLQQRLMIAENKLKNIDFASMRLNWLFKVLENDKNFNVEFVDKCSEEIANILTLDTDTEVLEPVSAE